MEKVHLCVCRVCLRKDIGSKKCFSVFESYEDSVVSQQITCIANVKIIEGDGLPDRICPDCLLQLGTALTFKRKCEASDKFLRSIDINEIPIDFKGEGDLSVKEEIEAEDNSYAEDLSFEYSDPLLKTENKAEHLPKKSKSIDLNLICNDCNGSFKSKCKLKVHWNRVHLPDKLTCPTCKRMFSSYKSFNRHVKAKSRNCTSANEVYIEGRGKSREFHCKHCSYKSKKLYAFKSHIPVHTGERPFECNKCDKKFTQLSSLLAHKEVHHKEYRLESTCHICGKFFKGRKRIMDHIRTHKLSAVQCDICNLILKNKGSLIQHMKRHSGVKAFSCEICPIRFFTSAELITHRRKVHLKHKHKFKCELCEYSVNQHDAFIRHKSKHSGTNVPCLTCGSFFDDIQKLEKHKKLHIEKRYACPHCSNKYATNKSRNTHIRKKHPDLVERSGKNVKKKIDKSMGDVKKECTIEIFPENPS